MDKDTKLKELFAQQKLLKFEISQTRRVNQMGAAAPELNQKGKYNGQLQHNRTTGA